MSEVLPGRRVSHGDSFYTDWSQRRGDSLLLRAQCIVDSGGSVDIELQTRAEPGPDTASTPSKVYTLTPTFVSNGSGTKLQLNDPGVFTALFRATDDGDSSGTQDSMQGWIRLKVSFTGTSSQYQVVRVLRLNFFDNAKP